MQRIILLIITFLLICSTISCSMTEGNANPTAPSSTTPQVSATISTTQQAYLSHPTSSVYFDDYYPISIRVYVDDVLIAEEVLHNPDSPLVQGPDNLGDFILAQPVLDTMGIRASVIGDRVFLRSEAYGELELTQNEFIILNEKLYIQFSMFRYYSEGSLKQVDEAEMYLYTPDFEREDIPSTLEECYSFLDSLLASEDIDYLRSMKEDELIELHFSLGLWIRNNWLYPTQSHITDWFLEIGYTHIDDISYAIIKGYWSYLNEQEYDPKADLAS